MNAADYLTAVWRCRLFRRYRDRLTDAAGSRAADYCAAGDLRSLIRITPDGHVLKY